MFSRMPWRQIRRWRSPRGSQGRRPNCCSPLRSVRPKSSPAFAVLPQGRRRASLEAAANAMFGEDFAGRVLPFDSEAAIAYADVFSARRRAGRPAATADLMISAIAHTKGASVVTRDIGDFEDCGLTLIDPWTAG